MYALAFEHNNCTWPYKVQTLINPTTWQQIFQTTADNKESIQYNLKSINAEVMVQIENEVVEATPITCTYFVVSLKKEVAQEWCERTQNGTTLLGGIDYSMSTMGLTVNAGLTHLNPDIFNIHYEKKFIVGDVPYYGAVLPTYETTGSMPVSNIKDANKRFEWKIPFKKILRSVQAGKISQTSLGWGHLTEAQVEPTDRLYCFLFNNAPTGTDLFWSQSTIIDGDTIAL
jgi:hypothetical protein